MRDGPASPGVISAQNARQVVSGVETATARGPVLLDGRGGQLASPQRRLLMSQVDSVVLQPAPHHHLVPISALRTDLGNDVARADLVALADRATEAVCEWLRRPTLARELVLETHCIATMGRDTLRLLRRPADVFGVSTGGVALHPRCFAVDRDRGEIMQLGRGGGSVAWWRPREPIVIRYAGGYVLPPDVGADLPQAIAHAARQIAIALWHRPDRDPTPAVAPLLGPYRARP